MIRAPWLDLVRDATVLWRFLQLGAWFFGRRLLGLQTPPQAVGLRLRHILERMGVTYVKLGQFLAVRFDLLHPDLARELSNLFDAVPPVAAAQIRAVIETEFGVSVETLFAEFEWECIAAASIAQVHRARLHSGALVAVKVQRPHVPELFAADIRLFRSAAWLIDHVSPMGGISLAEGVSQFESYTVREMDFNEEAQTCRRLRRTAGPYEAAPRPYLKFTRRRVLTMEFESGVPLSKVIHLLEQGQRAELEKVLPGARPAEIARRIAQASFRQIFERGFFHADPHPGNIFVRPDGTIVFVDFGIFGNLTDWELNTMSRFVEAAAVGNVVGALHYFSKLLVPRERTDVAQMNRDLSAVIYRWQLAVSDVTVLPEDRHFGRYVNEFLSVARRHGTGMSLEALLFWRALIALNGTALRLDPQTDVLSELSVFFRDRRMEMVRKRFSLPGTALGLTETMRLARTPQRNPRSRVEMRMDKEGRQRKDRHAKWAAAVTLGMTLTVCGLLVALFSAQ